MASDNKQEAIVRVRRGREAQLTLNKEMGLAKVGVDADTAAKDFPRNGRARQVDYVVVGEDGRERVTNFTEFSRHPVAIAYLMEHNGYIELENSDSSERVYLEDIAYLASYPVEEGWDIVNSVASDVKYYQLFLEGGEVDGFVWAPVIKDPALRNEILEKGHQSGFFNPQFALLESVLHRDNAAMQHRLNKAIIRIDERDTPQANISVQMKAVGFQRLKDGTLTGEMTSNDMKTAEAQRALFETDTEYELVVSGNHVTTHVVGHEVAVYDEAALDYLDYFSGMEDVKQNQAVVDAFSEHFPVTGETKIFLQALQELASMTTDHRDFVEVFYMAIGEFYAEHSNMSELALALTAAERVIAQSPDFNMALMSGLRVIHNVGFVTGDGQLRKAQDVYKGVTQGDNSPVNVLSGIFAIQTDYSKPLAPVEGGFHFFETRQFLNVSEGLVSLFEGFLPEMVEAVSAGDLQQQVKLLSQVETTIRNALHQAGEQPGVELNDPFFTQTNFCLQQVHNAKLAVQAELLDRPGPAPPAA